MTCYKKEYYYLRDRYRECYHNHQEGGGEVKSSYRERSDTFDSYDEETQTITIQQPVVTKDHLQQYPFTITHVKIEATVENIDKDAFEHQPIRSVVFEPKTNCDIHLQAFRNCSELTDLYYHNRDTDILYLLNRSYPVYIKDGRYDGFEKYELVTSRHFNEIIFLDGTIKIEHQAFLHYRANNLVFPPSLCMIGEEAFDEHTLNVQIHRSTDYPENAFHKTATIKEYD